ncbi:TonB-dependent receptor [Sediminibacterium soli]|uniref:TonB-dependent receptor n=1 Tax=Sediminibacterium soli TaxID=2698829 RepID=UPI00137B207B|nr:TonB-dependent receptor [Sediminibacterium soli]NCI46181.1 TonB-dependent receptor [Sediminibacterium soli]
MQYLHRTGLMVLLMGCVLFADAQTRRVSKSKQRRIDLNKQRKAPQPAAKADTTAPKTVTITSAFKPFLKNAAKLNFTAASPVIDSSKIPVAYQVPSQNLFFSYQPVAIKPLALPVDSGYTWNNHQYIKLGAGNFSSYYVEAGFSFGDGKHSITNLKGNFLTTTGHQFAQQANRWEIDALSIINSGDNHEWTAHAFYNTKTQYQYGFQPNTIPYTKDDLLRQYNTVGINVGLRNKIENAFGISYHPQISFVRIEDNRKANNYDFVIKAPISKSFGKIYSFNLGLTADMSKASMPMIPNPLELTNNLYYLNPSIRFKTPNVKINAGLQPSWDNKQFSMLPDITAEAKLTETGLVFEAGWIGSFRKNTFGSLVAFNPWITSISSMKNTRIREQFAGIKGALGSHFTFQGRVSLQTLNNQPLFVNDIGDGKTFQVLYEPEMKSIRVHGEAAYSVQEKFSFLGGITFNQYHSLSVHQKAYGLLPLELTGSAKWKLLKDLQLRADVFLWDGAPYRDKAMNNFKSSAVADLNFGAEFTVIPKLNLWLQMNNLLNTTYQRWNQYPVLGFNVLGGIVYSFK